ncbi:MLP-like protein 28 [Vigna unguiculata]|uniref:MLP-like protein 28 n=1 Tax=Vigna unguiculata TaxID=3917 RepID=UPI0010163A9C|nr:MLP-like protein 28 [Vigna unguiculata]
MAHSQVQKMETEVHIKASADKFYDVFCNKPYHIANISPQNIQSVQIHNGNWGTEGSILTRNYMIDGKTYVEKEMVEGIDKENKKLSFKVIEGDLMGHYKTFKSNLQVIPKEKGSVVHWTMEFEKHQNNIPDPHTTLQLATEVTKDIDSYLTQDHK